MTIETIVLKSLLAALTSIAYSIIFNVRGRNILFAGLCGGLGYALYVLLGQGHYVALFYSGMLITLSSEIFARINKVPATLYLVGGLLPLVPGRELFRMFSAVMEGKQMAAMGHFWNAILQAGALAIGTIIIGSLFHFISIIKKQTKVK